MINKGSNKYMRAINNSAGFDWFVSAFSAQIFIIFVTLKEKEKNQRNDFFVDDMLICSSHCIDNVSGIIFLMFLSNDK